LRAQGIREFDRKTILRLTNAAKVAVPGKQADVTAGQTLRIDRTRLWIAPRNASQKQIDRV
jgi:hypothetical protein